MSDPPATSQNRLLELADQIYEAGAETNGWPHALRAVAAALDAPAAHVLGHDFVSSLGHVEHSSRSDPEREQLYTERYAKSNPWLAREDLFRVPGRVWRGDQLVPQSELVGTVFYEEFLRPWGVFHTLHLLIDREGPNGLVLQVERPRTSPPFTARAAEILFQLSPVLRCALRVNRALGGAESLSVAAVATLDAFPLGVCIVGSGGSVLSTNRTARELLSEDRGVRLDGDFLHFADRGAEAALQSLLGQAQNAEEGAVGPLELCLTDSDSAGASGQSLHVVVSPVPAARAGANGRTALAAVFLVDPDRRIDVGSERLRALYSLTPAEARLAVQLADGLSLQQASERLGVSYQTSRSHLKRIFAKTGTERQPELVRVLLNGRIGRICL